MVRLLLQLKKYSFNLQDVQRVIPLNGGEVLKQIKTIKNIKGKRIKRRKIKVVSILFVVITLVFSSISSVFAASNSWGLITSQIDGSYFYWGISTSEWSVVRQRCRIDAQTLVNSFNMAVVDTNLDNNIVTQLEYIYVKEDKNTAVQFGTKWNTLHSDITNLMEDVKELCGYENNPPKINGNEVTVGEYQSLLGQITECRTKLDELKAEIKQAYASASYNPANASIKLYEDSFDIFTSAWNQIGILIKTIGSGETDTSNWFGMSWTTDNMKTIADTVSVAMRTFAYAVAVILFGLNVSESALQFELTELKGWIKIFARLILVKFWIDLSVNILLYILNMLNFLSKTIFDYFTISSILPIFAVSYDNDVSNNIFGGLGSLLNLASSLIGLLPMLILIGLLIFCVLSVVVKIIARAFELTALIAISPPFFACLVGENTKSYFTKFLTAFLSTAAYTLYIALVYAVATMWIAECTNTIHTSNSFMLILPIALIIIACCNLMRKPPKVLTSLLEH